MAILLENKILQAAEQKVESQLTPQNRADYMKIVAAGMRVGMQGGPKSIIASLQESKNPISDAAVGAVHLVLLMAKQSRGTMPPQAMVPAAMTLMLQALDFAGKMGLAKIGNDELAEATHIFTNTIFARFGVTAQMLHTAASRVHAITQDPAQMEKLNRAAGVVKDPRASTPTQMQEDTDGTN